MLDNNEIVACIDEYLSRIETSHHEKARKEIFVMALGQLFPEHRKRLFAFAQGAEKLVKIDRLPAKKRGFIDTFYGNLVIEFEHSLPKKLDVALGQLRGYVATLWSNSPEGFPPYVCVATDGVIWKTYAPRPIAVSPPPFDGDAIELVHLEDFDVRQHVGTTHFYTWLDRLLLRENLIPATSEAICRDFGARSNTFVAGAFEIKETFEQAANIPQVKTCYRAWSVYLKYVYGSDQASPSLFACHVYLSCFVKLMLANVIAMRRSESLSLGKVPQVIDGQFFEALRISNLADHDFFSWVSLPACSRRLADTWQKIFNSLKTFDFSDIREDFLKAVYQDLVHPTDRHDLGEYYTPDWLCEKIVSEAVALGPGRTIPRVGDVTCGSGSFLRAAIIHLKAQAQRPTMRRHANSASQLLRDILERVVGFEVHPLAVLIAKVNYLLAIEDLIAGYPDTINIPIYFADSLMAPDLLDVGQANVEIEFDGQQFVLSSEVVRDNVSYDKLINYADRMAHQLALEHVAISDMARGFTDFAAEHLGCPESLVQEAWNTVARLVTCLAERVRRGENTIWAFVLKNNFKPEFFQEFFDVVLGNPPWLSFRYVLDVGYRKQLEKMGIQTYGVAPKQAKLRTHMELGTIFLAHSVSKYLRSGGQLHFVLPHAIFSAEHHSAIREGTHKVPMRIDEIWDLTDVAPLFNVPACVLSVSKQTGARPPQAGPYTCRSLMAKLPERSMTLAQAAPHLHEVRHQKLNLVRLNTRTALSTRNFCVQGDGAYVKSFRQGADLMPRSFYFVQVAGPKGKARTASIRTHGSIESSAKAPYRGIDLAGLADAGCLFHTAISENILPFCVANPYAIHLPVTKRRGRYEVLSAQELEQVGKGSSSQWFRQAEKIYADKAQGRDLYEALNYHNKLLVQNPEARYWVLFNASGTNVCCAVYENTGSFWADQKTYYFCPQSREEAYYLCGIINASTVNDIIKPFQSQGLAGERDIHKKVLEIGFPRYDERKAKHRNIAKLAMALSDDIKTSPIVQSEKSLARKRGDIRSAYAAKIAKIEGLVQELIGFV